ncbi:MAG: hypothetical protein AAF741_07895 [Bacteroidota bacterium]
MAKYLLAGESINWLAVFALLTFMFIFVMAAVLAYGRKKSSYAEIAALPLDDGSLIKNMDEQVDENPERGKKSTCGSPNSEKDQISQN